MAPCTSARYCQGSPKGQAGLVWWWPKSPGASVFTVLALWCTQDDLYLQQSIDACHDAIMRTFGAIPALQHAK